MKDLMLQLNRDTFRIGRVEVATFQIEKELIIDMDAFANKHQLSQPTRVCAI